MDNLEISMTASSKDRSAKSHIHAYPSSWTNYPSMTAQSDQVSDNESYDGIVGIEEEAITDRDVRGTWKVEDRLRSKTEHSDLGLWLFYGSSTRQDQWEHLRMAVQNNPQKDYFNLDCSTGIIKRLFDIVGSLFLLILLLPLFLLVSIMVKLDSPGPVFFRHDRVGRHGKHFVLWKFRSMRTDVPRYEVSPQSVADGRLTRVGRLVRRLSIDEMPQLINVLKGEMSLVGPRPEMPFIVARYHPIERLRLVARPGITGLWQISPARAFPIHENLQYDLHYLHNQSLLLDCAIILRTVTAVIHGVGAV
jgi:lipopolysaccharide/colanic/teichoic acid biosynthesis glycosyltransferase